MDTSEFPVKSRPMPPYRKSDPMQLTHGRLTARLLAPDDDLTEAQALRHLAFRGERGMDSDPFDALCRHLVVHDGDTLVACARLQDFPAGAGLGQSYAAAFYDLSPLPDCGPSLELGRFCLHPSHPDPTILRLAWGLLTQVTEAEGVRRLFGCSSFPGAGVHHAAALAALHAHIAHPGPGRRAAETQTLPEGPGDPSGLPPLLRFYLALGAKVSDHAVIDREMDTTHVLTLLDVAAVPPARARILRLT
jgi:putative hemolysin